MLPDSAERVLDFGCGPGNFTFDLARKYSEASIVGVDRELALLPPSTDTVEFLQWDGQSPMPDGGQFDLIISKMTLHYLSDDELRVLAANLLDVLAPDGRIAFSVPHPVDSSALNLNKRTEWQRRNAVGAIKREIGATGLSAAMFHRNTADWMNWLWRPMKARGLRYTPVIDDDIYDSTGQPKRLNLMFVTQADFMLTSAYERIEAIAGPPQETVLMLDPSSALGRELLEGDLATYPDKPLP